MAKATAPWPYCKGPGMSAGNRPRFPARQRGQVLISASTVNSRVSKTRSTRTRRPRPVGSTPARPPRQERHSATGAVSTSTTRRFGPSRPARSFGPLPLAPGRPRALPSDPACEPGRPELREFFGVSFSMNTAISTCKSISRASTGARPSALILPAAHSASNRPLRASNSGRSDALFTVATGYSASTAMIAASTASRSAAGMAR